MVGLEKAISWQRYKWSTIMKVPGKSANEPTWFQFLSQVCSFYGVGAVKAGKKVVDNRGLTLLSNTKQALVDFDLAIKLKLHHSLGMLQQLQQC